ncbi:hypothetical protein SDC9_203213 [bioreactor metagenome]|uniref:Uncharacterized protein n=1 Tax=bioreactor metagenome TaxID=1076179 RepID=A0A645IYK2_9ZZZZ
MNGMNTNLAIIVKHNPANANTSKTANPRGITQDLNLILQNKLTNGFNINAKTIAIITGR